MAIGNSTHAKTRIKQRMSIGNEKRVLTLALERGIDKLEFVGSFRRYLDKLSYKENSKAIVYDNHIFLIKRDTVITVIKIPTKYLGIKPKIKEKVNV